MLKKTKTKGYFSISRIVRIAILSAVMYVMKFALESVPNVEMVSLLTIMYTIVFGKDAFFIVTIFNMIELVQWGPGTWWISYLYVWPLLVLITLLLRNAIKDEYLIWAIVSGLFGLIFGSLFAVFYIFVDVKYAFSYWISGLPWDVVHCIANFILMLFLGKPVKKILMYIN